MFINSVWKNVIDLDILILYPTTLLISLLVPANFPSIYSFLHKRGHHSWTEIGFFPILIFLAPPPPLSSGILVLFLGLRAFVFRLPGLNVIAPVLKKYPFLLACWLIFLLNLLKALLFLSVSVGDGPASLLSHFVMCGISHCLLF